MQGVGKLAGASPALSEDCGDAHNEEIQDVASVVGGENPLNNNDVFQISDQNSLIWISIDLQSQEVPAMVDSGANPNCIIAYRCIQGSPILRQLPHFPYSGKQIVDANGEPIKPDYVVKCQLQIGTPKLIIETEFVVIKSLPFSCIIGQKTLRTFNSWEVSNINKILTVNQCHVIPFYDSNHWSEIRKVLI